MDFVMHAGYHTVVEGKMQTKAEVEIKRVGNTQAPLS